MHLGQAWVQLKFLAWRRGWRGTGKRTPVAMREGILVTGRRRAVKGQLGAVAYPGIRKRGATPNGGGTWPGAHIAEGGGMSKHFFRMR